MFKGLYCDYDFYQVKVDLDIGFNMILGNSYDIDDEWCWGYLVIMGYNN